jgi:hypothetical protein
VAGCANGLLLPAAQLEDVKLCGSIAHALGRDENQDDESQKGTSYNPLIRSGVVAVASDAVQEYDVAGEEPPGALAARLMPCRGCQKKRIRTH